MWFILIGNRQDAPDIVLIISDEDPNREQGLGTNEARKLREDEVFLFAVGVGGD